MIKADSFAELKCDVDPMTDLFSNGKVNPRERASFSFTVTDLPKDRFYLVEEPRLPSS